MTADEMFRELGYVRKIRNVNLAVYRSDLYQIVMQHYPAERTVEKRKTEPGWDACGLTRSEAQAVDKLLEEMEGENG